MLLWIVFACVTAAALVAVLKPLLGRGADVVPSGEDKDLSVYRDQLTELEADVARGVISAADAEIARREIARRMLRAAETVRSATPVASNFQPARLGFALAAILPVAAIASYAGLGSPHLPARPFAEKRAADVAKSPLQDLIAKVEAQLARHPGDGMGWDVIAPVYFRLERFDDAARAFQNAARILGETSERLAGFAEATVMAANGIVTEPAREAYEKLRVREPDRVEPRFWLTLAKEQDGKKAEAIAGYRALLDGADANAPWRPLVEQRLAVLGAGALGPRLPQSRPGGPSAEDVKAAEGMTDADRGRMISGMVEGLAARLKKDGKDPAGWQRLVQAYLVLGDVGKARSAAADAKVALKDDSGAVSALAEIDALIARAERSPSEGGKKP